MNLAETRYVTVGEGEVAYQVFGAGPDLLMCYGVGSHIEFIMDIPSVATFYDSHRNDVDAATGER